MAVRMVRIFGPNRLACRRTMVLSPPRPRMSAVMSIQQTQLAMGSPSKYTPTRGCAAPRTDHSGTLA
jgi:hypothetical protein